MAAEAGEGREGSTAHRLNMRVIWSPLALREIARATEYLNDFNPRAATRLAEGLLAASGSLEHFSHRGSLVAGTGLRELITAFPSSSAIASSAMKFASFVAVTPPGGPPRPDTRAGS
jgi:plasmid stabilization system protein ParE